MYPLNLKAKQYYRSLSSIGMVLKLRYNIVLKQKKKYNLIFLETNFADLTRRKTLLVLFCPIRKPKRRKNTYHNIEDYSFLVNFQNSYSS